MIYLYVKIHNKTGLKYLGQTQSDDPFKYPGSGLRWQRHIKKHGKDVSTQILLATENEEELKQTGIFFSKLWGVVQSKDWANLKEETGNGNSSEYATSLAKVTMENGTHPFININQKRIDAGTHHLVDSILVVDINGNKRYMNTTEYKNQTTFIAHNSLEGRKRQNLPPIKQSPKVKATCPHCGIIGGRGNLLRYHFDNCKE